MYDSPSKQLDCGKVARVVGLSLRGLLLLIGLWGWGVLLPGPVSAQVTNQAGLIVMHGNGTVVTRCVDFAEPQISGYDLLARSGLALNVDAGGGVGTAICSIDQEGCTFPQQGCFCQCEGATCIYWSYWQWVNDSWRYSSLGAAGSTVLPGAVEGWAWGAGTVDKASPPPILAFGDICAPPPTATATPSVTPPATMTETPLPTATATLIPTATETPWPTATLPPVPAATQTPWPTVTITPLPTVTPLPTAAPIPTLAPPTSVAGVATTMLVPSSAVWTVTPLPTATTPPLPTFTATLSATLVITPSMPLSAANLSAQVAQPSGVTSTSQVPGSLLAAAVSATPTATTPSNLVSIATLTLAPIERVMPPPAASGQRQLLLLLGGVALVVVIPVAIFSVIGLLWLVRRGG